MSFEEFMILVSFFHTYIFKKMKRTLDSAALLNFLITMCFLFFSNIPRIIWLGTIWIIAAYNHVHRNGNIPWVFLLVFFFEGFGGRGLHKELCYFKRKYYSIDHSSDVILMTKDSLTIICTEKTPLPRKKRNETTNYCSQHNMWSCCQGMSGRFSLLSSICHHIATIFQVFGSLFIWKREHQHVFFLFRWTWEHEQDDIEII